MLTKIRNTVLVLIIFFGLIFLYLSFKRIQLIQTDVMVDSFAWSAKEGDTVSLGYPIEKSDIKDIFITVDCFSTDYGGRTFAMENIKSGEMSFAREFKCKDELVIYKGHELFPGDSFEDTITYKSKRNIFTIVHNRLKIKNEGFVKGAIVGFEGKRISFDKPVILLTGRSYDSFSMNKLVVFVYYTVLFLFVCSGLTLWYLQKQIKKKKTKLSAL